jgi:hypothetical protein
MPCSFDSISHELKASLAMEIVVFFKQKSCILWAENFTCGRLAIPRSEFTWNLMRHVAFGMLGVC